MAWTTSSASKTSPRTRAARQSLFTSLRTRATHTTVILDDDLDGLPDEWETGAIKPGGLDLKALGCKPGRADVIVEIERFDTVDVPLLETEVPVTVRYFASLPVANPDGTRGIAMHIVYRPPTPHADFDTVVKEFDKRYPPRHHIGAVHTMFCGAEGDPGFSVAVRQWCVTASSIWAPPSTT